MPRSTASLALVLGACAPDRSASIAGYDLSRPAEVFRLEPELREISGLTDLDESTVVCVQDELGVLFFVDLRTGRVRERHAFGEDGDYEGVTRVGGDYWVLRSDGRLLRVAPETGGYAVAETFDLELEHEDVEGLGHDPRTGRLLVAPKDRAGDEDRRPVFAFDPGRRELEGDPVLELSVERLVRDAARMGVELPTRTTKKGRTKLDLKIRPSAVAAHPLREELWLLSAVDELLLVVTPAGELVGLHAFGDALPKPEGITFLPDGDVLISSEGPDEDDRGLLLRFDHVPAVEQRGG